MANVTLDRVRKVYDGDYVAIEEATFEAKDGELLVFVGPSGCGKSTLLRMIAGLEEITSGTIRIGDRIVNDVAPQARDVAMVFQTYALYPHMTVRKNLAFGLKLRKASKEEIDRRVGIAADLLELGPLLDRKPKQLSGGQRQRVALGRALVREPAVFLLDEPLSNLDAKLRLQMRTEIAKLHRRLGTTMIYVTHDQIEAMTLGDRIVVLNDGRIQQIDTPMNLYLKPKNLFVAGFIGSPAMNFIRGRVEVDPSMSFISRDGALRVPLDERSPGGSREAILGVRPEDLDIDGRGGETVLELVEPVGNETFVYARAGETQLVARVAPTDLPKPDSRIGLRFDPEKLHLFDPSDGARL
ncbi:MAG: sn-glycerol-3-phosphate ABC transporter ATP-binding protein UgpC [Acidobacteria bacterium]|nr:sn-glycerol-3-phosphate ABC transporter ATP-binding protein UgpC [Acidobacteriota bacterium]